MSNASIYYEIEIYRDDVFHSLLSCYAYNDDDALDKARMEYPEPWYTFRIKETYTSYD